MKKQRVVSTHSHRSEARRGRDSQRTSKQSIVRKLQIVAGWSNERSIIEKTASCLDAFASKRSKKRKRQSKDVEAKASSVNFKTSRGGATSEASLKKQRVVSTHSHRSEARRGRDSQRTSKQSIVRKHSNRRGVEQRAKHH
nr:hypothetical protein [Evansella caseinilytica]